MQACSQAYDMVVNSWSADPVAFCLNTARSDSCAGVIGNKIYVAGELFVSILSVP